MSRPWVALATLALCAASIVEADQGKNADLEAWTLPVGGTRALLGESDHKYQMHDPIKLYGKAQLWFLYTLHCSWSAHHFCTAPIAGFDLYTLNAFHSCLPVCFCS